MKYALLTAFTASLIVSFSASANEMELHTINCGKHVTRIGQLGCPGLHCLVGGIREHSSESGTPIISVALFSPGFQGVDSLLSTEHCDLSPRTLGKLVAATGISKPGASVDPRRILEDSIAFAQEQSGEKLEAEWTVVGPKDKKVYVYVTCEPIKDSSGKPGLVERKCRIGYADFKHKLNENIGPAMNLAGEAGPYRGATSAEVAASIEEAVQKFTDWHFSR